jgi:predicted ATPase
MFSFQDLCGKPVAAADYIGLCNHFHTLVLKGVPIFTGANRQEGYRWGRHAAIHGWTTLSA